MADLGHAGRIIAHELRRLATDIERGDVPAAILDEADHLVDAYRDAERHDACECCGAFRCGCRIETVDGFDAETGPYTERGCATHGERL